MSVQVRMYNTGFGDCFLLTFPAPDRPRKVLIDCGKHTLSKTGPKLTRVVDKVLEDIAEPSGPKVDIVVATHRHRDHVQGFSDERWKKVTVGEVWMPWTEDPNDAAARDICERQSRRAARLNVGIDALAAANPEREYLLGYAGNNLTNSVSMNLLHEGFQGAPERRFLPAAEETTGRIRTDFLPGVEVYVLGPPRSPDVMRQMNPPENESFIRAWETNAKDLNVRPSPFTAKWFLQRTDYEKRIGRSLDDDLPIESETKISQILDTPSLELLARLEEAVNATSLVLLFHIGDAWLLFPGDAQWGTWNAILNHPVHSKLLENLTFYKVGHHGSHNATPISFVDRYISDRVLAMIPYGKVDQWPTIPRAGLLTRFSEKGVAFARSDNASVPGPFKASVEGSDVLFIDAEVQVGQLTAPA